jgi:hypothetical protein
MIVFDNSFLTLLLSPDSRPSSDPATGAPTSRLRDRIELFLETMAESPEVAIIPTPALAEFLLFAGDSGPAYLTVLNRMRWIRIADFDTRSAIELAAIQRDIRSAGKGRRGSQEGTYAKITFDRQIVAIARVNGARTIYSEDEGVYKFATTRGLSVVRSWELPLPPEPPQMALFKPEDAKQRPLLPPTSPPPPTDDDD